MTHLIADIRRHPILFATGSLGLITSFALLVCSTGTNDIRTWESFAREIQAHGLFALYTKTAQFNHPPLMGMLAWLSLEASSLVGISFAIVFKLFPVLANIGGALALRALWRHRAGPRKGAVAFALFHWALCPMFVAAYHGNTDCTAAFFCLWSVYFLEVRRKPFLGGLALAAAINVKIVPLLIALPALSGCRSPGDARAFALGSGTAALPFLVGLFGAGMPFLRNVFGYGSSPELWGVQMVLASLRTVPGVTPESMAAVHQWYFENGKYLLLAAILALTAYGFRRRLGPARLMAAGMALFLLLTPGFGVQYTAYPAPLLFAVSLAWGMKFSLVAGIYIGLVYASWSIDVFPLASSYRGYDPSLGFLGFATWWIVLSFLPGCLRPDPIPAGEATSGRASDHHPSGNAELPPRSDR